VNLIEFHFLRPAWLVLIPISIVVTFAIWRFLGKKSTWGNIVSPKLLAVLTTDKRRAKSWPAYFALCFGWLLAVVAMAGPSWERRPQPLFEQNQSRVIVFDLSLSMNSSDLKPSRLQQAKFKLIDLIQTAKNKQQALVVFAGDGFIVSPFTNDSETLINLIPSLGVDTVPVQGSRADKGLEQAALLIDNASVTSVEIVLITDGVNADSVLIAKKLAAQGHKLEVLGVGTSEGAPILLPNGSLLKDESGDIVIPALDRSQLQALASAGGGSYANMGVGDQEIARLNSTLDSLQERFSGSQSTTLFGDSWVDAGTWLLLPLLLIASLSFRKGWLLVILILVTPVHRDAHAWQAAAAFKQKRFDDAVESYEGLATSDSSTATDHYNFANALAKSNALREALASYDRALQLDPNMQDAIYNRNIIKNLLEQQQQQQNNPESNTQGEKQNQEHSGEQGNQEKQQQSQESSSDQSGESEESQSQNQGDQQKSVSENRELDQRAESDNGSKTQEELPPDSSDQDALAELEQQNDAPEQSQTEEQQALEQWLKKVPDDPGGLLKRKFQYQYRLREQPSRGISQW